MANLKVKNLLKSFGKNTVINDVCFDVAEGEFCILLGPSGCGKTTVLRIIAGLEQQTGGEIYIDDKEVSDLSPKERDIAMVFQSYALYPHLNVYDNLAFSLKIKKLPKQEIDEKVKHAARLLDIEPLLDRKPKELSGGQRQRVAVGRAIVRNPKLFLFDEPLSNLDAKLRGTMRVELAKLHQKLKATMIYVTHDQVEAMTLGEKIILFNEGIIQQIATPREVYERPANIFAATFIGSPPINLLQGKISNRDGKPVFESGDIVIDTELKQFEGKDITLGIRPESLTPGVGPVTGELELIEHIGSETLVYLRIGDNRIISKAPADFHEQTNKKISLSLDTSNLHYFYEGERIETQQYLASG